MLTLIRFAFAGCVDRKSTLATPPPPPPFSDSDMRVHILHTYIQSADEVAG